MTRKILLLCLFCLLAVPCQAAVSGDIALIPVQNHGRIKPFSAFAHDTLQFISGKDAWQGQNATEFLMGFLAKPQDILKVPFIRVDHPSLKQLLGVGEDEHAVSALQIEGSLASLEAIVKSSSDKRARDERPSTAEQQAETVYQRYAAVTRLASGELLTVIPAAGNEAWGSPYFINSPQAAAFQQLVRDYADHSSELAGEVGQWISGVNARLTEEEQSKIRMEAGYTALKPFYRASLCYLLAFILLLIARPLPQLLGSIALTAGFVFHTAGLALRALILSRPPVANMYETMIFMDWALVLCVGFYAIFQKRRAFLSSGALASVMVMLYANLLPVDQSLDVLAPVLRSSYWLTIHVITIMFSYSLFTLAMAVSHRHLFLSALGKFSADDDKGSAHVIYRLLQAGLIALGAGTILGGVWANETWGRFWGWDPKETWAFITFLGYMAILHLRYSKRLDNFALAVAGVIGFLFVLMTWYGVNFVLGRGLHSYGSGSGGALWIIWFLAFEAVFLAFVSLKKKAVNKS